MGWTSWRSFNPRKTRSRASRRGRSRLFPVAAVSLAFLAAAAAPSAPMATGEPRDAAVFYRPALEPPEVLEPFLPHVKPGGDAFLSEKEAAELGARLAELAKGLE